ncbi:MAG: DUF4143 domain-containing protein [Gammaproteobacteria bacterium]|nr:DUF4143 domain-containing protein [Gammaproteobacteria bacterium]
MYRRKLELPTDSLTSFFLWGVRQSGKTTLLKERYPDALFVDLLQGEQFDRYRRQPQRLRQELQVNPMARPSRVVIDEVQRVPELLNEVHWLIENEQIAFAICSSNARRLRRGGVNLLGGRALSYRLHGLSARELRDDFNLVHLLNRGFVPRIYDSTRGRDYLDAYVYDYLTTEVAIEAELRNMPAFSEFLTSAALADTEIVNFKNVAADCGVSSQTVKNYYEILVDAMHGDWLPSFRRRPKRRVTQLPKFYFSDVGVVNVLSRRNELERESVSFGHAFENWVFHELQTYMEYTKNRERITYWRLSSGNEVDFIIGDMRIAIEAKAPRRTATRHFKGLRELVKDHPEVSRRILVCSEDTSFVTDDHIEVLSEDDFVLRLWDGELTN